MKKDLVYFFVLTVRFKSHKHYLKNIFFIALTQKTRTPIWCPLFFALRRGFETLPRPRRRREWAWSPTLAVRDKARETREKIRSVGSAPRVRDRGDYIFEWDFQIPPPQPKKETTQGVPSIKQVYLPKNQKEYGRFVRTPFQIPRNSEKY